MKKLLPYDPDVREQLAKMTRQEALAWIEQWEQASGEPLFEGSKEPTHRLTLRIPISLYEKLKALKGPVTKHIMMGTKKPFGS